MSFKMLEKRSFSTDPIPEGFMSIDKGGTARFHTDDLELAGIDDTAIVLVDESTLRIALRKPRDGEEARAYRVAPVRSGSKVDPARRQMLLRSALNELRIEPRNAAGRYELRTKDDLLIVSLADIEGDGKEGNTDDGA